MSFLEMSLSRTDSHLLCEAGAVDRQRSWDPSIRSLSGPLWIKLDTLGLEQAINTKYNVAFDLQHFSAF